MACIIFLLLLGVLYFKCHRSVMIIQICLFRPMGDVVTGVSVMYMIVHLIRDRWGGPHVWRRGGVGVFLRLGYVYVG